MKASFVAFLALVGVGYALPATSADPVRTLPKGWDWEIIGLEGEGCPDFNKPIPDGDNTRLTYGQYNTNVPEVYYWFIAFPFLRGSVEASKGDFHISCDVTLKYSEYEDYHTKTPADDYRLRMHKNGTQMIAQYDIMKGASINWKFTYYDAKPEIVDEIQIDGPRMTEQPYGSYTDQSLPNKDGFYKLPNCGSATVRFGVELTIVSGKDASAEATSEVAGSTHYGVQQGFSYDWEKCEK